MKKKLFALVLTALLALPVYADTLFLMKPVVKEIDKSDADKITAAIESAVTSNYNTITYRDLPKGKINKLGKCGMKAECWVEKAEDEDFQYVLLSLVAMNEDEEIKVRLIPLRSMTMILLNLLMMPLRRLTRSGKMPTLRRMLRRIRFRLLLSRRTRTSE